MIPSAAAHPSGTAEGPAGAVLPDPARAEAALRLFRRSVLKQAKLREIAGVIGRSDGLRCLDVGGDNGVISLRLRQLGGTWWSADLDGRSVRSIRDVVGGCVVRIGGGKSPFRNETFDLVVIVDFLEHTITDQEFLEDMARILTPGGCLIVHVPQARPKALVNRIRHAIGLTDQRHGHVRPGYSVDSLRSILPETFAIEEVRAYSRTCSELIEVLQSFAYDRLRRPDRTVSGSPSKGPIITAHEASRHRGRFTLLGIAYPVLRFISWLDRLLILDPGYRLIVKARLRTRANDSGDT